MDDADTVDEVQWNVTKYLYGKCLIVEYQRSYLGILRVAHYHDELFHWKCIRNQKFQDMVIGMLKDPDYDGHLSEEGKKLRLKFMRKVSKL